MKTWYLTFGQRYRDEPHPSGFDIDPDGYVKISAASYDAAREIAVKNFGLAWCFLYSDKEIVRRCFPAGCILELKE